MRRILRPLPYNLRARPHPLIPLQVAGPRVMTFRRSERPPFERRGDGRYQWEQWCSERLRGVPVVARVKFSPVTRGEVQAVVIQFREATVDRSVLVTFLPGVATPFVRLAVLEGLLHPVRQSECADAARSRLCREAETNTFHTLSGVYAFVAITEEMIARLGRDHDVMVQALSRLL